MAKTKRGSRAVLIIFLYGKRIVYELESLELERKIDGFTNKSIKLKAKQESIIYDDLRTKQEKEHWNKYVQKLVV